MITSSPVYRTETLFATSTIPLFLGNKKFFTTLTQSIGVTTVTDFVEVSTVNPAQQENPFAGMFGAQPGNLRTDFLLLNFVQPNLSWHGWENVELLIFKLGLYQSLNNPKTNVICISPLITETGVWFFLLLLSLLSHSNPNKQRLYCKNNFE